MMLLFKKRSTKDLVHPGGPAAPIPPAGDDRPSGPARKKKRERKARPAREGRRLSVKDVVKSRPFIGGLCILFALLLAFVATPMLQMKIAETVPVVVLKQPVPAGAQLTGDMLSTVEMGVTNLPMGALHSTEEAVGKFMSIAGASGDILTSARLSDQFPSDDPILTQLPEGTMAMSATLNDLAQRVSGKLRSGDVIRLYASLDESAELNTGDYTAIAVPELQYVEVLAVTNATAADVLPQNETMGQAAADSDRQIATVTLAVTPEQAAVLAGLEHSATLHAALVVRGDAQAKAGALAAQQAYFEQEDEEAPVQPPEGGEEPTPSPSPEPSAAPEGSGQEGADAQ